MSDAQRTSCANLVHALAASPGQMVVSSAASSVVLPSVLASPRKIAVIANMRSASATELLLIYCHASTKVKIFGSATRGAVDYTELLGNRSLPCPYMYYGCPAARRGTAVYPRVDGVGIQPDVAISERQANWVDIVQKYLDRD